MKKIKHIICGFILLPIMFSSFAYTQTSTELQKKEIIKIMTIFLDSIRQKKISQAKELLDTDIVVQYLDKFTIKSKIDQLILSQISAVEYLQLITGHNLQKFVNRNENIEWELQSFSIVGDVYQDSASAGGQVRSYHFVKVNLQILEKKYDSDNNLESSRVLKKTGEIDIIEKNSSANDVTTKYKIFGFII